MTATGIRLAGSIDPPTPRRLAGAPPRSRMQEFQGKAFVGYASLRFMARSRALIGMQKFETTCAVEVACLRGVSGSQDLIDYAVALARNPNINGLLHWGQRNDWTMREVEPRRQPRVWRQALSFITDKGRLDGFSSDFTCKTGLEVVVPLIGAFSVDQATAQAGETAVVTWDCASNPPDTRIQILLAPPSRPSTVVDQLPLAGQHPHHRVVRAQCAEWCRPAG